MSSLSVVGFFCLRDGRVPPPPSSAARKATTYAFYSSHLICLDGSHSSVEVRSFLPARESPLPNLTVAFIYGNLFIPESKDHKILLDTTHIVPVPGDPAKREEYNTRLPMFRSPLLIGVGHVATDVMKTAVPHSMRVVASSYVRGSPQSTAFTCIFTNQARWAKIPILNIQSCVYVTGLCQSIKNRHLSISVDSIATSLSASTSPDALGNSSAIGSTENTSLFDPLGPSDDNVISIRQTSPVPGPSTFVGSYDVVDESPPADFALASPHTQRPRTPKNAIAPTAPTAPATPNLSSSPKTTASPKKQAAPKKPATPKKITTPKKATTPKTPRARAKAPMRIESSPPSDAIMEDLGDLSNANADAPSDAPIDPSYLPAKRPRRM